MLLNWGISLYGSNSLNFQNLTQVRKLKNKIKKKKGKNNYKLDFVIFGFRGQAFLRDNEIRIKVKKLWSLYVSLNIVSLFIKRRKKETEFPKS